MCIIDCKISPKAELVSMTTFDRKDLVDRKDLNDRCILLTVRTCSPSGVIL